MLKPDPRPTSGQFPNLPEGCCITLIGMAGAGKTTVGRKLAKILDWAFLDTDRLIESAYGAPLQRVADALDKEGFLDMEAEVIQTVRLNRCVLSTGGSVVYREAAMRHLQALGPIIHLDAPLPVILERIARNPDRGLAIAPGQTMEDLFREREELYRRYARFAVDAALLSPAGCASAIAGRLSSL